MLGVEILHCQQVLCLECFDVSEVTTRKGNESIVRKDNCFLEEIKVFELRSRRGKFIYNRTYNPVGLNKVTPFSRRGRHPGGVALGYFLGGYVPPGTPF